MLGKFNKNKHQQLSIGTMIQDHQFLNFHVLKLQPNFTKQESSMQLIVHLRMCYFEK